MKILMVSLGCDKNLVDTEMMLGMLAEHGYTFTDDESEAEVVIVNTCCFIGDAKEESINTLIELGALKQTACARVLIATGCLAQRYAEEIRQEIPEVDAIVGTLAIDEIVRAVEETLTGKRQTYLKELDREPVAGKKRVVTTGGHYAYLKIAEGCDKRCSYCIIPKVRGGYRSVPMETLVKEAQTLADSGVKELILVAQETTVYGKDLYGEKKLPELLRKLCGISGLYWIRLLYCYPEEITQELIDVIRTEKKICHYLDMPIQHASDEILKKMGRRTNRAELTERIARIRECIPDICIRTTLITGFPGETKKEHEELLSFVEESCFDSLGAFLYSPEEGTAAAEMPEQIPEKTKKKRRGEVMALQQKIAFDKAESFQGRVMTAMIEGKLVDEDCYVARTYRDAPNVDGYVFLHTDRELVTGDFVNVRITGAHEYDLIGELVP